MFSGLNSRMMMRFDTFVKSKLIWLCPHVSKEQHEFGIGIFCHNQPHKYLDPKINLSEFRQISVKLTPRRATYLVTLRERDLSLGKLCA
ncbi:hypothetical protein LEP1GSC038_3830 [Leptospira weilii str. 2006001855]|uniref:Uncharacterized protein n=1 Tax=Leptospira weilii str. 2006001855 TaxID=996804 RepID=M6FM70_9LEPT|nr:hypothetical protein LEP1GSC038_3830 [Leptospira weilii str. 2006001855]EMN46544.1 hypothetical protein LEP1GSC086_3226 [Leptospira weilii str. LNT 1234]